ncbi:hypothetical protein [Allokutzneria oryzae]|uniref:Uncharacterized protein n=1 Tax=Allokutzneria oryzae TaxID=1378989 RepID=A0ABV6A0Y9_9PSEU
MFPDGRFLVLADDSEPHSSQPVPVPVTFTFADRNPITGEPYERSRFRDLPGFVAAVVTDYLDMPSAEWNLLVEYGEVAEFVDPHRVFTTTATGRRGGSA